MRTPVRLVFAAIAASLALPPPAWAIHQCVEAISHDVFSYMRAKSRCVRRCENAILEDLLPTSTSCDRPSDDPRTERCLQLAEGALGEKSMALVACTRRDIREIYGSTSTCPGEDQNAAQILTCLKRQIDAIVYDLAEQIYAPFRYPVCGDGEVTAWEGCDPNAFPTGCADNDVCHPTGCYCTFRGCRNGIIDPGEDCDPFAWPNGCGFTQTCGYQSCRCEGPYGSAGRAFLDPTPDLLR